MLSEAIDHAILFILVDREDRIVYRFIRDERQQSWLGSTLRSLLSEQEFERQTEQRIKLREFGPAVCDRDV